MIFITDEVVSLDGGEPVKQSGNVYDGDFQSLLYHAAQLDGDRVHHIQVTNTPGQYFPWSGQMYMYTDD
jgi:hypothetical protein